MLASEPSARAKSAFCWLPPESERMLLWRSGVRMPIFFCQVSARSSSRSVEISRPLRSLPMERIPMFYAIDHSGKMPSACRSPATSATGAVTSIRGVPWDAAAKISSSKSV